MDDDNPVAEQICEELSAVAPYSLLLELFYSLIQCKVLMRSAVHSSIKVKTSVSGCVNVGAALGKSGASYVPSDVVSVLECNC